MQVTVSVCRHTFTFCLQAILWKYLLNLTCLWKLLLKDMLTAWKKVKKISAIKVILCFHSYSSRYYKLKQKTGDGNCTGNGSWPVFNRREFACLKMVLI